jgi:formylglycine-generating enzyme required for sulfatase activity
MVYVPGGECWVGSDESDPQAGTAEKPRSKVSLDAFWIDRTEVTNAQYRRCEEAGSCSPPNSKRSGTIEEYYGNPEHDDYPVVNVTWRQTQAYAEWVGGRLPTEAEWEYAARGQEGRTYPWGERVPDESLLNYGNNVRDARSVGTYPEGQSWCGALDMGGNVWEWTQSKFWEYPYDATDGRDDLHGDDGRVLRGGAFDNDRKYVRCAWRRINGPDDHDEYSGFRIVLDSPG